MNKKLPEKINKPLRVLIVDDEPSAREIICEMLNVEVLSGEVEIVGECGDGKTAVKFIKTKKPNLLFLDIQMPEMNGFEVLETLSSEQMPLIIFVTAYDQYALRAFEVHAIDYLLKPFDKERFDKVFDHAKKVVLREQTNNLNERVLMLLEERNEQSSTLSQPFLERLIIKTQGRVFFLRIEEIRWIKAEGNYVSLHTDTKTYLFRESISLLEKHLNPRQFQRIHRSTIVNMNFVKELQPLFRGEYTVIMQDGTKLKLSRNFRESLQKSLGGNL